MPTGREKHGNLQIAVKLAGVLKLSVRCRFLGFANVEDPHSAVSTAMSTTYNSFGHAKKHLSCFAVLCNLTSRNAPNIRLTLKAYAPPRFYAENSILKMNLNHLDIRKGRVWTTLEKSAYDR